MRRLEEFRGADGSAGTGAADATDSDPFPPGSPARAVLEERVEDEGFGIRIEFA